MMMRAGRTLNTAVFSHFGWLTISISIEGVELSCVFPKDHAGKFQGAVARDFFVAKHSG